MTGYNSKRRKQRKRIMNFCTWNVQGVKEKIESIVNDFEKLKVDVAVLSETKRKGKGTESWGNFIHFYSGVPKHEQARRGVSIFVRKSLKKQISNWEAINENMMKLNLELFHRKVTIIAVYAPSDNELVATKDEFYDNLQEVISNIGDSREIVLMGDFNVRTGSQSGVL